MTVYDEGKFTTRLKHNVVAASFFIFPRYRNRFEVNHLQEKSLTRVHFSPRMEFKPFFLNREKEVKMNENFLKNK